MNEFLRSRLFLILIIGVIFLIGLLQFVQDIDQNPCAPTQYPGRCYRITQEVCESTWQNAHDTCMTIIKKLKLPTTRLTGPIEFNCQSNQLDKTFHYLRISNDDCDEQFEKIEKWKKTNPDF